MRTARVQRGNIRGERMEHSAIALMAAVSTRGGSARERRYRFLHPAALYADERQYWTLHLMMLFRNGAGISLEESEFRNSTTILWGE
jgi:hypothetical protein